MFVAILLIAVLLLAVGAVSAWQAFLLVPTDLGLAYMQGAYTSGSAGLVALALGLAARRFVASWARAVPPEARSETIARPDRQEPQAELPGNRLGVAVAGAGAAIGVAAGAALGTVKPEAEALPGPAANPPGSDARLLDDLEKDLFADLPALPKHPDAAPAETQAVPARSTAETNLKEAGESSAPEPASHAKAAASLTDELAGAAAAASPLAATAMPGEGTGHELPADLLLDDPAFKQRVRAAEAHFAETLTLPPAPAEGTANVADDIGAPALLGRQATTHPEPESPSADPPVLPAMSDVAPAAPTISAGLIHDADLAALETELPPLTPIEKLEEIGSYESGGTRFTMYSDGSVNTLGPDGERRFRTLDELRAHIDRRGR